MAGRKSQDNWVDKIKENILVFAIGLFIAVILGFTALMTFYNNLPINSENLVVIAKILAIAVVFNFVLVIVVLLNMMVGKK